jgi:hypothetical protein
MVHAPLSSENGENLKPIRCFPGNPALTVASRCGSLAPPLPACDGPRPVTRNSVLPGSGPAHTPPKGCMPDGAVAQ